MKPLRWLVAGLVWIVAGLLGLIGALLSITILLLPLGIPIIMLARRLFSLSARLVVPRAARHPAQETGKAVKRQGKDVRKTLEHGGKVVGRGSRKARAKAQKSVPSKVADAVPGRRRSLLSRVGIRRG